MPKNKKKTPGRPKKEFISKKPKVPTKAWPGRPRKDEKPHVVTNKVSPVVVWFVEESVDTSKKKDVIILALFLFSFILFLVSLYFTFIKDKKVDEATSSDMSEITNVDTGNIDYPSSEITTGTLEEEFPPVVTTTNTNTQAANAIVTPIQSFASEQQMILDFYQAVNSIDTATIHTLADAHLKQSSVFITYYSKNWLSKFSAVVLAPKIVVSNIQEKPNTTNNPNIRNFSYTLEYTIAKNQQKFTEERSTVLLKKGDAWKIGKLMCETKGCSTMPFFNPDKYK